MQKASDSLLGPANANPVCLTTYFIKGDFMDINQIIEHVFSALAIIISLIDLWDRRRSASQRG